MNCPLADAQLKQAEQMKEIVEELAALVGGNTTNGDQRGMELAVSHKKRKQLPDHKLKKVLPDEVIPMDDDYFNDF